ncbi:hypothetical protein L596_027871 [Steinernema carpocapsae]|uniref:Uncharacterized protein n=1 Tax=Steinernema carpocapsae TaxID=34508 RepID=A0A4V5ZXQ6_STECR|nr:hypothetical protein L596_027871 [Steinernema carpocapsae]
MAEAPDHSRRHLRFVRPRAAQGHLARVFAGLQAAHRQIQERLRGRYFPGERHLLRPRCGNACRSFAARNRRILGNDQLPQELHIRERNHRKHDRCGRWKFSALVHHHSNHSFDPKGLPQLQRMDVRKPSYQENLDSYQDVDGHFALYLEESAHAQLIPRCFAPSATPGARRNPRPTSALHASFDHR